MKLKLKISALFVCAGFFIACQKNITSERVLISEFSEKPQLVGGSPEREEWEYKLAFEQDTSIQLDSDIFFQKIGKFLDASWKNEKWKLAERLGQSYYAKEDPQTYLYEDFYFDTPNKDLLKNKLSYRLRYRFKSILSSVIHEYMPSWEKYWPIRCEIQFKGAERLMPLDQQQIFLETRFEFRNASPPFIQLNDAPKSPWPLSEYISFARRGRYQQYKISPMDSLIRHLRPETDFELDMALKLKTSRVRWHIELKNPFGSATNNPNPSNMFFITWDEVRIGLPDGVKPFIEVEIEADRSSLDEVQDLRKRRNMKNTEAAIRADQKKIYQIVKTVLKKSGVNILQPQNKYHRIMNAAFPR